MNIPERPQANQSLQERGFGCFTDRALRVPFLPLSSFLQHKERQRETVREAWEG